MAKRHLKLTGDLGRVVFIVWIPNLGQRTSSMARSDWHYIGVRPTQHCFDRGEREAFGCCLQPCWKELPHQVCGLLTVACYHGHWFQWSGLTRPRNFSLEDVHVEGAERIAEAVAKYDVDRFIHVSSHNANLDSPSEFFRTKVRLTGRAGC